MNALIRDHFDELRKVHRWSRVVGESLSLIRAGVIAALALGIWNTVNPADDVMLLVITVAAFFLTLVVSEKRHRRYPDEKSYLMHLEMRHPQTKVSAFILRDKTIHADAADWQEALSRELGDIRQFEVRRYLSTVTSLVVPALLAFLTLTSSPPSFRSVIAEMREAVAMLQSGATLKVIQGAATELPADAMHLSAKKPVTLELLAPNLLELRATSGSKKAPIVELRKPKKDGTPGDDVFQTFQMSSNRSADSGAEGLSDALQTYSVQFGVTDSVDLIIASIASKPLAHFHVKQLPVPKVTLKSILPLTDPWPDDQPLLLQINAEAENSLATIRLLIRSAGRTSTEVVNTVMSDDKKTLTTEYRLTLESYIESDLAEVEVIAEAVDRALPSPLIGQSEPLKIHTASAYGRYKQALNTLRELKGQVDTTIEKKKNQLPTEARDLTQRAIKQSENSPFFDGLDRVQIEHFGEMVANKRLVQNEEGENILDLSQNLNQFLFEHEILDDRERDRDFFVAVRGLSRLVEQERNQRPLSVASVAKRLSHFLDERQGRWRLRVERLPATLRPAQWPKIQSGKPFQTAMRHVEEFDTKNKNEDNNAEALTVLSKTSVEFRSWIEELEAKEDEARSKAEQERQQGLSSARNELRELQKRQGEISAALDHAAERKPEDIAAAWPATRMNQNTNVQATQSLEGKLRALSPGASERIKVAIEQMEATTKSGNENNFAQAESSADLAGRLLRQAEQATRSQQQRSRDRGRRRRVTGDNYYGQSVVGGDIEIKREYEVDKKYREDILDEIRNSNLDEENRSLLDNYLRQVIR